MQSIPALLLGALAIMPPATFLHAQKPYKVEQRWVIGGDGSWDYMTVDSNAHPLYIAHLTRFEWVDLGTGKLAGAIEGLTHCHGIVIAPGGKTGFISDGGANRIVFCDLS